MSYMYLCGFCAAIGHSCSFVRSTIAATDAVTATCTQSSCKQGQAHGHTCPNPSMRQAWEKIRQRMLGGDFC
eukprot:888084-Alexandrium_andersonii.AAC.1